MCGLGRAHREPAGRRQLRGDQITAATTGLLDARTRDWPPAVARTAGIDTALLRHLTSEAGKIVGRIGENMRDLLGLPAGDPIANGRSVPPRGRPAGFSGSPACERGSALPWTGSLQISARTSVPCATRTWSSLMDRWSHRAR